jgi:hypothetical protein
MDLSETPISFIRFGLSAEYVNETAASATPQTVR